MTENERLETKKAEAKAARRAGLQQAPDALRPFTVRSGEKVVRLSDPDYKMYCHFRGPPRTLFANSIPTAHFEESYHREDRVKSFIWDSLCVFLRRNFTWLYRDIGASSRAKLGWSQTGNLAIYARRTCSANPQHIERHPLLTFGVHTSRAALAKVSMLHVWRWHRRNHFQWKSSAKTPSRRHMRRLASQQRKKERSGEVRKHVP